MLKIRILWLRPLLVIFIGFSSLGSANGRTVDAAKFLKPRQPVGLSSSLVSARYFSVDSFELAAIFNSREHLQITNFPGGTNGSQGQVVTLDLKPAHSPIDATTQFLEGTTHGDVRLTTPQFVAYRGKVLGEPNSCVFLTAYAGRLLCSITRETGEVFVLGPAKTSGEPGLEILTRESDLLATTEFTPFNCVTDGLVQPEQSAQGTEPPVGPNDGAQAGSLRHAPLAVSALLQTDIAIEADSCFYAATGGTMPSALGYIASLFAMSSSIYEDEANITWHLTWIKVWTSGDPYKVAGNAYALEDTVPKYWRAHYADVPRDLAHVMTSIGYGGGGFGYYSLCDTNWSFSVSSPQTGHQYPTFAFTYDAYIVAHEIGHNFGLHHTHSCWWNPPLDTCYTNDDTSKHGLKLADACYGLPITPRRNAGTIMSYCQNANYALSGDFGQYRVAMTFSPRGDDSLRKFAGLAPCIQPPDSAGLNLLSPQGSETYRGDTSISILWSYEKVDSVSIDYSQDGGSNWKHVATSIHADVGHFDWTIPNVPSNRMLVRVFNPAMPSEADTSLTFFVVAPNSAVEGAAGPQGIEFAVSPEPAHETLTIATRDRGEIRYDILDVSGVSRASGRALISDAGSTTISLATLPPGTYFLRVTSPITSVVPFVHE